MSFYTEYLCLPYNVEILDAAEEYESTCEAFDRLVCSGSRNGVAMPVNGNESGLISRHAKMVANNICKEYRITWKQLREGLRLINHG